MSSKMAAESVWGREAGTVLALDNLLQQKNNIENGISS